MKKLLITALSGAVTLLPVIVVLFLLGKLLDVIRWLTSPFTQLLNADTSFEYFIVDCLAVGIMLALLVICGWISRAHACGQKESKLESFLIRFVPGYTFVRGLTAQINGDDIKLPVVLVRQDDGANIGFEIERKSNGWVTVFIPGSPQPWSGGLIHMSADRVISTDITYPQAIHMHQMMGAGSANYLPDVLKEIEADGLVLGHPVRVHS